MRHIKEECGVFGVFSPTSISMSSLAYFGLSSLQHRGQESCGVVINENDCFKSCKNTGLVNEVLTPQALQDLGNGDICIGHVRYCTTGGNHIQNAQPILINRIAHSLALAHNGNIVNAYELRKKLELEGSIFHSTNDTEVIAHLIIKNQLSSSSLQDALQKSAQSLNGAYSLVLMDHSQLIAMRDPHGFRPLCYGQTSRGEYIIASETSALDAVEANFIRDILPGEIVVFDKQGVHSIQTFCNQKPKTTCSFEYIYFARADSSLDGQSIHLARMRAGEFLAKTYPVEADIVIGVPDSGIDAAIGYARASNIPYGVGFIKNRYIARTFISPTQEERIEKLRLKLNPILPNIKGKKIILIDDSIVRGNTTKRLVKLLRGAGAKEIHMRVSSPPFLNPCFYGTDIDSKEYLIACAHSVSQIEKLLGLDSLGYLTLEGMDYMLQTKGLQGYCSACFTGNYPTPIPNNTKKNQFENKEQK
ncbi:amidophosphoribosyltransferase [Helicobacter enhydrae]|uniref:Amidophosphoribosyltransferase n=1 Tax=Helicobacter enhydrae TaxID=222136 RepID=A0A1B1U5R7_9HELI|nr:amidophosphoribosyltransferase [Helicobacter enhydrae]ANV98042.1 amidophosphoribosyltransferase [Helicobacter enhydrae]